jgi:hypothetical protein
LLIIFLLLFVLFLMLFEIVFFQSHPSIFYFIIQFDPHSFDSYLFYSFLDFFSISSLDILFYLFIIQFDHHSYNCYFFLSFSWFILFFNLFPHYFLSFIFLYQIWYSLFWLLFIFFFNFGWLEILLHDLLMFAFYGVISVSRLRS